MVSSDSTTIVFKLPMLPCCNKIRAPLLPSRDCPSESTVKFANLSLTKRQISNREFLLTCSNKAMTYILLFPFRLSLISNQRCMLSWRGLSGNWSLLYLTVLEKKILKIYISKTVITRIGRFCRIDEIALPLIYFFSHIYRQFVGCYNAFACFKLLESLQCSEYILFQNTKLYHFQQTFKHSNAEKNSPETRGSV